MNLLTVDRIMWLFTLVEKLLRRAQRKQQKEQLRIGDEVAKLMNKRTLAIMSAERAARVANRMSELSS